LLTRWIPLSPSRPSLLRPSAQGARDLVEVVWHYISCWFCGELIYI
jgi:hypothetical protein